MTPPLRLSIVGLFTALSVPFAFAQNHDGHDHSSHNHVHGSAAAKSPQINQSDQITLNQETRDRLGIRLGMVDLREFGNGTDAVIAIPKSSVFQENGKTYVLAQSQNDKSQFERWEVKLGASDSEFVEAVSGVFPGDNIVANGTELLTQSGSETAESSPPGLSFSQPNQFNENRTNQFSQRVEPRYDSRYAPDDNQHGSFSCPFDQHGDTHSAPRERYSRDHHDYTHSRSYDLYHRDDDYSHSRSRRDSSDYLHGHTSRYDDYHSEGHDRYYGHDRSFDRSCPLERRW
tara:strand:- start:11117 stop:11980 length:864 start_codon:yes stop_codon:yes gene_type:complete